MPIVTRRFSLTSGIGLKLFLNPARLELVTHPDIPIRYGYSPTDTSDRVRTPPVEPPRFKATRLALRTLALLSPTLPFRKIIQARRSCRQLIKHCKKCQGGE